MDYKEKYEMALERAKGIYKDTWNSYILNIFPELAESEDERIRKDCIKYLDWEYQHCPIDEDKMKIEKCIAWLEKQTNQSEEDETIELLAKDM